jgi:hypothetical protein
VTTNFKLNDGFLLVNSISYISFGFGRSVKKPNKKQLTRSLLFSVMAQMNDGRSVKFLFPEGITIEEYERSLDMLYELLSTHYGNYPNDEMSDLANSLKKPSHVIYLEYSNKERRWIIIDPLLEAEKARKIQEENNK